MSEERWRIVDATGAVREVSVRAGHSVMSGVGYFACLSANDAGAFGASERVAVMRLAVEYRMAVAEILAPGEPTRAEAVAAARREAIAACERVAANATERLGEIDAKEDVTVARSFLRGCVDGAASCAAKILSSALRDIPLPGDEVTP